MGGFGYPVGMSKQTLLGYAPDEFSKRDAIHAAVYPATAANDLRPSQSVFIKDGKAYAATSGRATGIVDPFRAGFIKEGSRVWIMLYPNTVTGLRHHWFHPDIPEDAIPDAMQQAKENARMLLERVADAHGVSYDDLLWRMESFSKNGDYFVDGGRWEGQGVRDKDWDAYELVTGEKVSEQGRGGVFSCSC